MTGWIPFSMTRLVVHGRSWLVKWFVWLIPITNEVFTSQ